MAAACFAPAPPLLLRAKCCIQTLASRGGSFYTQSFFFVCLVLYLGLFPMFLFTYNYLTLAHRHGGWLLHSRVMVVDSTLFARLVQIQVGCDAAHMFSRHTRNLKAASSSLELSPGGASITHSRVQITTCIVRSCPHNSMASDGI